MSDPIGSRIAAAVRAATDAGLEFRESRQREVVQYVLERDHWRVAIDVAPDRMIGIAVEARRPPKQSSRLSSITTSTTSGARNIGLSGCDSKPMSSRSSINSPAETCSSATMQGDSQG